MNTITALALACPVALMTACSQPDGPAAAAKGQEPIVGLPCEGCEGVFVGLPEELDSVARIGPADEPGEALVLTGTVRDQHEEPVGGVIVYAYQTDAQGIYPSPAAGEGSYPRHGSLRAWAMTDSDGWYTFRTIRPASYPNTTIPQHIHMHVIEPGRCTYYIDDVYFEDDPNLPASKADRADARGGNGVTQPTLGEDGQWRVTRDITLGAHIPGYPGPG